MLITEEIGENIESPLWDRFGESLGDLKNLGDLLLGIVLTLHSE